VLALEIERVPQLLEFDAQMCMIDRADDAVVAPDLVGMKRLPFAVRHAGQVGDHGVDMRLRVECPAGVVLEERIDQIAGLDGNLASFDVAPAFGEIGFDPIHCLLHSGHVRAEHPLVAGDIGHHRG